MKAPIHSNALEACRVVSNKSDTLVSLIGFNSKTSEQYIQIHDANAEPANGAIPIAVFLVPARSNFSLDVPLTGLVCINGITVCNSSTVATKTVGAQDCFFTAVIR